jgi:hypothetical protein
VAAGITAIGGRDAQGVIAADVAQTASRSRVAIGQRETRCRVIEHARGPGDDWVAAGALRCSGRESGRNVIWHRATNRRRALEHRRVAAVAIRRTQRIVVAHVARCAGCRQRRRVRSDKSKASGAVIERGRCKAHRRMASAAICYCKSGAGRGVRRGRGPLPAAAIVGVQMAAGIATIGRGNRQRIIIVNVAKSAGHRGMRVGQRKACCAVVKNSRRPGGD